MGIERTERKLMNDKSKFQVKEYHENEEGRRSGVEDGDEAGMRSGVEDGERNDEWIEEDINGVVESASASVQIEDKRSCLSTKYSPREGLKAGMGLTVFAIIFAFVYNRFGHGIHSVWMDRSFLCPLLGLCAPSLLLSALSMSRRQRCTGLSCAKTAGLLGVLGNEALLSGTLTLLTGSILQGIFVIAGTRSQLIYIFAFIGMFLAVIGFVLSVLAVFFY